MQLDKIKKLLLPWDEYPRGITLPYKFTLKNRDKYLYYFGAEHFRPYLDGQYEELELFWREFLEVAGDMPKIVFNEGGLRNPSLNKEESIKDDYEAGLATYLATKDGVSIMSPEPSRRIMENELVKSFTREQIQYHFFAQVVHQWGRKPDPKPDFEVYISGFMNTDKEGSDWDDFDFSIKNMEVMHRSIFDNEMDKNDVNFFYSIINPTVDMSIINRLAREVSRIRDAYIVSEVVDNWNNGNSIFVVYGFGHAIVQKPALEKLLG